MADTIAPRSKMKFSEEERAWNWEFDERPEIEIIVAGDSTAPDPRRLQILKTVLNALDAIQKKVQHLLQSFIREQGTFDLTGIHLGEETDKLDCDFILHYIFRPASDPQRYDTYFDVCFYSKPDHPSEAYRLHAFKFVVGFY